jgi:hypothetical protein
MNRTRFQKYRFSLFLFWLSVFDGFLRKNHIKKEEKYENFSDFFLQKEGNIQTTKERGNDTMIETKCSIHRMFFLLILGYIRWC